MSEESKNGYPLSCVDCSVTACRFGKDNYPEFCLTKKLSEDDKEEVLPKYFSDDITSKCSVCSVEVEGEYYGQMARVEETMEFARRIGAEKIGLAYCSDMVNEAELYARILRINGFSVVSVICKYGELDEGAVLYGTPNGRVMCNPIGQAQFLNAAKTDMNILIGLCVGSDSLFIKHSDALTTIMINKDRLTCNNPAVTLYRPERRKLV